MIAEAIDITTVPQGQGSRLNSDQVDGIDANTVPMPSCLVPLGPNAKFPSSTIPGSGPGGLPVWGSVTPTSGHLFIADGVDWESVAMSGDATIVFSGTLTLANSGVTAATYGDTTHYPIFTVDAKGRITTASNQSVPTTSPGTPNLSLQYDNSGAFGGISVSSWNDTTKQLTLSTGVTDNAPLVLSVTSGTSTFPSLYTTSNGKNFVFINSTSDKGSIRFQDATVSIWELGNNGAASDKFYLNNLSANKTVFEVPVGAGDISFIGNIIKINNVTTSWPGSQGASNTFLKNDGSGNLSWDGTVPTKAALISHYCGYFRTESGLTLPVVFFRTTNDSAITVKRITVEPVIVSIGAGTGTTYRFTDGTTNCDVILGPGATSATATFTQNYAVSSSLVMKVQSDDNGTPPTDINMVVEYIIQ